jgi:hypothetical protein
MLTAGGSPVTFWEFLNHWWNLPYLVMLGLVGVFFVLQAVGMLAHEHDLEGGSDSDAEIGSGSDGAADSDADGGSDADADGETDSEGHTGSGHVHGAAAFLGVGRVPFMVVWLTLFIFTGFTGLFLNRVLQVRTGVYPAWFFPPSLLASLAVGLVSVRVAARTIGKLVDVGGRGASARRELRGAVGVVASPVLDGSFGEVRVHDPRGNELIVHGHVAEGDAALRQGDRVVLIELESESGLFHVAALKE